MSTVPSETPETRVPAYYYYYCRVRAIRTVNNADGLCPGPVVADAAVDRVIITGTPGPGRTTLVSIMSITYYCSAPYETRPAHKTYFAFIKITILFYFAERGKKIHN